MVKYTCEKCCKEFSQKSHYDTHKKRKNPCDINTNNLKLLVNNIVEDKIKETIVSNNNKYINENIFNKSPLRYPGGKSKACNYLNNILNENFNINNYDNIISPFFGGGSFEFYIQNNYKLNIIANDKFKPLYNFWNICKFNKIDLCNCLYNKLDTIDKNTFMNIRENIMNEKDQFKQSIMYFIINRCSFSGATLSGGFSLESSKKRFTKSSIDRINSLNLNYLSIHNKDFEEFINEYNTPKNLIFLDPPYYLEKKSKLYGNNGDMHENFDHVRLFNCLRDKNNWIMTYNNCDYIKDLYKDYTIIETEWNYGMNKSKKSSEIVIINNNSINSNDNNLLITQLKNKIKELEEKNIKLENEVDYYKNNSIIKGSLCSINGKMYEKEVYKIVNKCSINDISFNTQTENELGGSSSKNDIVCNNINSNIGIEIKKYNTPDWMQCSITYDGCKWIANKGVIPDKCKEIFNQLISKTNLYNGEIPPFINNNLTHQEWKDIKINNKTWNDIYIDIPSDTIRKLYSEKGCKYIQISNDFGLYHLGDDVCNFNVPIFDIEQQLRIRTKVHTRENSNGFCKLSIMASCKPKNINNLKHSPYSLDSINKLPTNLIYKN